MPPTVRGLGTTVDVELGDKIDPGEFAKAWSRCLVDGQPAGSEVAGPSHSMSSLTQAITHALIEKRRGELLMLHAGAVCNPRTGDAIAYVAAGGTGKTTLTRKLGRHLGYLTDETVGIEPHNWTIHPYPKPLSMRTEVGGFPKQESGPDELGLLPAHPRPRLTSLVLLRRDATLHAPRWSRLDLFDAILALAPETSSLSRLERPLHLLAELYSDLDGFWLVEYAESEQIIDEIANRVNGN